MLLPSTCFMRAKAGACGACVAATTRASAHPFRKPRGPQRVELRAQRAGPLPHWLWLLHKGGLPSRGSRGACAPRTLQPPLAAAAAAVFQGRVLRSALSPSLKPLSRDGCRLPGSRGSLLRVGALAGSCVQAAVAALSKVAVAGWHSSGLFAKREEGQWPSEVAQMRNASGRQGAHAAHRPQRLH